MGREPQTGDTQIPVNTTSDSLRLCLFMILPQVSKFLQADSVVDPPAVMGMLLEFPRLGTRALSHMSDKEAMLIIEENGRYKSAFRRGPTAARSRISEGATLTSFFNPVENRRVYF